MKEKRKIGILASIALLSCSMVFLSCAKQGNEISEEQNNQLLVIESPQATVSPANAEKTKVATAPLYTEPSRDLPPVECGSCHKGEYKRLRESNSKHRFDCTDCHEQLHAYVPSKKNYLEIMPKCSSCHDLPHGEAFSRCNQCHQDPHSPLTIPFSGVSRKIKNKSGKNIVACAVCHAKEGKEMAVHPCKHNTEVGCTGCHEDKHGVRPSCFDCHDPHVEDQAYADCLVCHAPHSAKNILQYPEKIPNRVCGSCHNQIYGDLQQHHTKHSDLQCANCHKAHGQIPRCQECHGEPHGAILHKRFSDCLKCHIDPHNLPVKAKVNG